ncbi:MAG: hypothetical protein IJ806_08095 [Ruminococcus sp.]|nr:hypothetical protein [Ruminococcus sp.]
MSDDNGNNREIKCTDCGQLMVTAQFVSGVAGGYPELRRSRKGALSAQTHTAADCYVCLGCGLVKFYAREPQELRFRTEK